MLLVCALAPRLSAAEDLAYTPRQSIDLKKVATEFLVDRGERDVKGLEILQGLSFSEEGELLVAFRSDGSSPSVLLLNRGFRPKGLIKLRSTLFAPIDGGVATLNSNDPGARAPYSVWMDKFNGAEGSGQPLTVDSSSKGIPGFHYKAIACGRGRIAVVSGGAERGFDFLNIRFLDGAPGIGAGFFEMHPAGSKALAMTRDGVWVMSPDGSLSERQTGSVQIGSSRTIDDVVVSRDLAFPEINEFRGVVSCGEDSMLTLFELKGNDATGRPRLGAARFDTEGRLMQLGEVEPGAQWERGDTIRDWTADDEGRLYLLFGDSGVLRVFEPPKAIKKH